MWQNQSAGLHSKQAFEHKSFSIDGLVSIGTQNTVAVSVSCFYCCCNNTSVRLRGSVNFIMFYAILYYSMLSVEPNIYFLFICTSYFPSADAPFAPSAKRRWLDTVFLIGSLFAADVTEYSERWVPLCTPHHRCLFRLQNKARVKCQTVNDPPAATEILLKKKKKKKGLWTRCPESESSSTRSALLITAPCCKPPPGQD